MNRIGGLLVGAFLLFFVVTQPHAAAVLTQALGGWLYGAASSMSTFVLESTDTSTPAPAPAPADARPPGVYGDHGRIDIVPNNNGGVG